jgi:hypothetical protein
VSLGWKQMRPRPRIFRRRDKAAFHMSEKAGYDVYFHADKGSSGQVTFLLTTVSRVAGPRET